MKTQQDLLTTIISKYRAELYSVMSEYDASNLRVFGSVARREATNDSDVDFIVDVKNPPRGRLFARAGLSEKFSRVLGRRVDIVFGDDSFVSKIDAGQMVAI